jgi:hypothetical protein
MEFLMKKVSIKTDSAELELLKNMLDKAGIRCALGSEQLAPALPAKPFYVEFGSRTLPISHWGRTSARPGLIPRQVRPILGGKSRMSIH